METIDVLNKKLGGRIKSNVSLAQFTSYKIGGPAEYYFEAESPNDIKKAVLIAQKLNMPYFILGRGSNVLIADEGFLGLVIHNKSRTCQVRGNIMIADSGINLSQLANYAKENNLTGIEFSAGIPGSLGGAIRGNAGAWGSEIKDVIKKVSVITEKGEFKKRSNKECKFGYRKSIFKDNQEIILSAEIELAMSKKEKIQEKIDKIVSEKRSQQEFEAPTAGCIFKNPNIEFSPDELKLKGIDPDKIKSNGRIPAAYLIDKLGLRGFRVGQAMISEMHANFIVNLGKATAEAVIILIGIIKQKVRNKYGIQLQEEIQYVGFNNKGNK